MKIWQGVEVEYCVPYINRKNYVNELLESLRNYKIPLKNTSPFLMKRDGKYTQFLINGGRAYGDISSTPGIYDILEIKSNLSKYQVKVIKN